MSDFEFDRDTAVSRTADGRYEACISRRWGIPDGPANGGYVMAIIARAVADHLGAPHPATFTCHFLAPAVADAPATVEVEAVKPTGRHVSAHAALRQDGREVARVLTVFTDLARADGPTVVRGAPPELPPIEDCKASPPSEDSMIGRFDYRMPPEDLAWRKGEPTGRGRQRTWLRFADGRPIDPIALLAITDAFTPPIFDLGLPWGWAPTLELTAHVRAVPAPGWLRGVAATRFVTDGYLEEDVEIWDSEDRLVAQARQLALAPRA